MISKIVNQDATSTTVRICDEDRKKLDTPQIKSAAAQVVVNSGRAATSFTITSAAYPCDENCEPLEDGSGVINPKKLCYFCMEITWYDI